LQIFKGKSYEAENAWIYSAPYYGQKLCSSKQSFNTVSLANNFLIIMTRRDKMGCNSLKCVISALILAAGLLTAPFSFAASITGDNFTVTVSEDFGLLSETGSGVAGSFGVDVALFPSSSTFNVDWIDADTFQIDWYSGEGSDLQNLTIALTDLNFFDIGLPVNIIGVTPLPLGEFDWPKVVSFTANSITVVYPSLTNFEAGDGSRPSFDVLTETIVPIPATLPLLATGLGILGFFAAHRRR
jgi:hypothetical protein